MLFHAWTAKENDLRQRAWNVSEMERKQKEIEQRQAATETTQQEQKAALDKREVATHEESSRVSSMKVDLAEKQRRLEQQMSEVDYARRCVFNRIASDPFHYFNSINEANPSLT